MFTPYFKFELTRLTLLFFGSSRRFVSSGKSGQIFCKKIYIKSEAYGFRMIWLDKVYVCNNPRNNHVKYLFSYFWIIWGIYLGKYGIRLTCSKLIQTFFISKKVLLSNASQHPQVITFNEEFMQTRLSISRWVRMKGNNSFCLLLVTDPDPIF